MNRVGVLVSLATLLPASALAQSGGVAEAVASITPRDVQARINLLADDSMRGRYTPSPELEEAATYVAGQFKSFGLTPLGDDGSFLQRYSIEQVRLDTAATIAVQGGPVWHLGREVAFQVGTGMPLEPVRGPVVVVTGEPQDHQALDAALKGRIAIVVPGLGDDGLPLRGSALLTAVAHSGVAALIVVIQPADSLWRRLAEHGLRPTTLFPWRELDLPAVLIVRDRTIGPVLAGGGADLAALRRAADRPLAVIQRPDLALTVNLHRTVIERVNAPNTVGLLEGSDPRLKQEYVVFSAHMDHVGVGRPDATGDSIYNGADDDASGTTAVIELAQAFARLHPRPKRSLIFLTVSGEERGLWGSSYFTAHPPVPIGQIVADLNEDMVGRNWKDTIVVIGRHQSDLGETLARVNARHPELDMTAIDDIWPTERFYYRSDHFNFARRGVPILFFFNGVHPDYHRPSDEPSKIEAEKESRIIKLVFYLGLEVANNPERPKWDPESYKEIVEPR